MKSPAAPIALVLAAFLLVSCAYTAHRSTSEVIDDASIQAEVKAQLIDDPRVDANEVNLEVKKGVVTLLGWVSTPNERAAVEDIAWSVSGVKQVNNNLRLKSELPADDDSTE